MKNPTANFQKSRKEWRIRQTWAACARWFLFARWWVLKANYAICQKSKKHPQHRSKSWQSWHHSKDSPGQKDLASVEFSFHSVHPCKSRAMPSQCSDAARATSRLFIPSYSFNPPDTQAPKENQQNHVFTVNGRVTLPKYLGIREINTTYTHSCAKCLLLDNDLVRIPKRTGMKYPCRVPFIVYQH